LSPAIESLIGMYRIVNFTIRPELDSTGTIQFRSDSKIYNLVHVCYPAKTRTG